MKTRKPALETPARELIKRKCSDMYSLPHNPQDRELIQTHAGTPPSEMAQMVAPVPVDADFDYAELDSDIRQFVHQQAGLIRDLGKRTAESVMAIGKALMEVKERLPHGAWLPWLKTEFDWTDQTARNFINVSERFKCKNSLNLDIDVSALYLIAAPKTPEPVRKEAIRRAESGERITRSVVAEIITGQTTDREMPRPIARPIATLTRKQVRKCRTKPEVAKKEILRIVKALETYGRPVQMLIITRRNSETVGVEIVEEVQ